MSFAERIPEASNVAIFSQVVKRREVVGTYDVVQARALRVSRWRDVFIRLPERKLDYPDRDRLAPLLETFGREPDLRGFLLQCNALGKLITYWVDDCDTALNKHIWPPN